MRHHHPLRTSDYVQTCRCAIGRGSDELPEKTTDVISRVHSLCGDHHSLPSPAHSPLSQSDASGSPRIFTPGDVSYALGLVLVFSTLFVPRIMVRNEAAGPTLSLTHAGAFVYLTFSREYAFMPRLSSPSVLSPSDSNPLATDSRCCSFELTRISTY
jgi:hypothetical protein